MIQPGRGGSIGRATVVWMRGFLMARAYFNAALNTRNYACNRRIVVIVAMSNKIALSDVPGVCSTV
jgi:hypothetical protein